MPLDHQELLDIQIPNTTLGSLRSASKIDRRFTFLYLTDDLLPSFLQVIAGPRASKDNAVLVVSLYEPQRQLHYTKQMHVSSLLVRCGN